jgi:hypothetical protein
MHFNLVFGSLPTQSLALVLGGTKAECRCPSGAVLGPFFMAIISRPQPRKDRDVRIHLYEVRPRKDRRGFDLISEALPFGRLWYQEADAAIGLREIL